MIGNTGYNGRMSIRGGGTRQIRCVGLDYGTQIISTADNESRSRRSFYSIVTTSSDFSITLAWTSWEDREQLNRWLQGWAQDVVNDRASSLFVTTSVPSRNFLRTAVLQGPLIYGEALTDVAYFARLSFVGASDPVTKDMANLRKYTSRFQGAKDGAVTNTFYPLGLQVSGAESLDGTFYDPNPVAGPDLLQAEPPPTPTPTPDPLQRFGQDNLP